MDNLPTYSVDLVHQLDQMYPSKPPTIDMTDRQIWIAVGQRQVVESLLTRIHHGDDLEELPRILSKE